MEAIKDYEQFLQEAKAAVIDLAGLEGRRDQVAAKLRQDKRALEAEKKDTEDETRRTLKKRLDQVTSGFDKEIVKSQDQLRRTKSRRETAKGKGIKERIADETAELHEENRKLKLQMKTMFKQNQVPALCNTRGYYALYHPRWPGEFLILLLALIVCFLAIPFGIYSLLPEKKTLYLVAIYFVCVLVFGGLYVIIGGRARDRYSQTLKEGRQLRNQVRSNKKKIRKLTRSIRKDRNEAAYNLDKYDDEIARIQQSLTEITEKKKDAINTFETVTKNIITDEITASHKARTDELTKICSQGEAELADLEAALKVQNIFVTERYASYLGKEYLTPEKLDGLLEAIRSGTALNLTEAMRECEKTRR